MKYIDRAKVTREQVDAAIAEAVRTGETLTITENGMPRMQVVRPQPIQCSQCGCSFCEGEEFQRTNTAKGTR